MFGRPAVTGRANRLLGEGGSKEARSIQARHGAPAEGGAGSAARPAPPSRPRRAPALPTPRVCPAGGVCPRAQRIPHAQQPARPGLTAGAAAMRARVLAPDLGTYPCRPQPCETNCTRRRPPRPRGPLGRAETPRPCALGGAGLAPEFGAEGRAGRRVEPQCAISGARPRGLPRPHLAPRHSSFGPARAERCARGPPGAAAARSGAPSPLRRGGVFGSGRPATGPRTYC